MPFFDPIRIGASGAADTAFTVDRSLRFNDDDSAFLDRTPSSASNRRTMTISVWVKGMIGGTYVIFDAHQDDQNRMRLFFNDNGTIQFFSRISNSDVSNLTTGFYRDPSAWYHIVFAIDTTQSTSSDRYKIYINGVQQETNNSYPAQNLEIFFNTTNNHKIGIGGDDQGNESPFDGYMAEFNFIDGQALTPSSFAETDSTTGQWNPIDTSGLTFGTNGFRLQFADNSGTSATTLGKDTSGNGNNYTPNNFATTDAVKDSPTNNFCVLNIHDNNLSESSPHFVYSEGNLKAAWSFTGTNFDRVFGSLFIESSDTNKYYWEATGTQNNEQMVWGVIATDTAMYRANNRNTGVSAEANVALLRWASYGSAPYLYGIDQGSATEGDLLSTSNGNPANNDIFSFVFDGGTGKFYVWFKGVELSGQNYSAGTSVFDAVSTTKTYALMNYQGDGGSSTKSGSFTLNFGQDSSFAGAKTAQGNTDANGIGDFYYSVPSGAKALCSANLPNPTIKLPNKHFDTLLYTGNGSGQTISGLNFSPDWLWIKSRSSTEPHELNDQVRGTLKSLSTNNTNTENTASGRIEAFTSDGFTVGNSGNVNSNSVTFVAWNWNAGDTDGKTYTVTVVDDSGNKFRFDGFGTSAVTLDLAEGGTYIFNYPSGHPFRFSTTADGTHGGGSEYTTGVTHNSSTQVTIVVAASAPTLYYYCSSHSGMGGQINTNSTLGSSNFNGSIQSTVKVNATAGFSIIAFEGTGSLGTVGHGLGVKPDVMIFKNRDEAHGWNTYHSSLGATKNLELQKADAVETASNKFNDTEPTSTVMTVNTAADTNQNNMSMICYCFSEVAGYSKFGSYTGNGNADGTFVFTGFRPAWIMTKNTDTGSTWWFMYDVKRETYNPQRTIFGANVSNAEYYDNAYKIDILSNGFKARGTQPEINKSGSPIIYLAFAESPFKYSRAR